MKRLTIALALSTACVSAPSYTPAPPSAALTEVPAIAVDAMCGQLQAEGMTSDVRVVDRSQPITTPEAIEGLSHASVRNTRPNPDAIRAIPSVPMMQVATGGKCGARHISQAEAQRAMDVMVLEFSPVFANPFTRGQSGTLVRMSLGGMNATWYWVPLVYRNNQWVAGRPAAVPVAE